MGGGGVNALVRACVCVCVCVCVRMRVCACVCISVCGGGAPRCVVVVWLRPYRSSGVEMACSTTCAPGLARRAMVPK